jgi:hypothetical protein
VNAGGAAYFRDFKKMGIYKDLRQKSVNRKILRRCSKKAKKQMTKPNV